MAKQAQQFMVGRMGDICYYFAAGEYRTRRISTMPKGYYQNEPKRERSRENAKEFATGSTIGRHIRDSISGLIDLCKETTMTNRLTTRIVKLGKTDSVSTRGNRRMLPEHLALLKGFEFNTKAPFEKKVKLSYRSEWDSARDVVKFIIDPFIPKQIVSPPRGCTHFRIIGGVSTVDVDNIAAVGVLSSSMNIPVKEQEPIALELEHLVNVNATGVRIGFLGIAYYQFAEGEMRSMEKLRRGSMVCIGEV